MQIVTKAPKHIIKARKVVSKALEQAPQKQPTTHRIPISEARIDLELKAQSMDPNDYIRARSYLQNIEMEMLMYGI